MAEVYNAKMAGSKRVVSLQFLAGHSGFLGAWLWRSSAFSFMLWSFEKRCIFFKITIDFTNKKALDVGRWVYLKEEPVAGYKFKYVDNPYPMETSINEKGVVEVGCLDGHALVVLQSSLPSLRICFLKISKSTWL